MCSSVIMSCDISPDKLTLRRPHVDFSHRDQLASHSIGSPHFTTSPYFGPWKSLLLFSGSSAMPPSSKSSSTGSLSVFEIEVGTRELSLDDFPEPVHWRTIRDVRGMGWTRATGEEGNVLAEGVDDDRPRVFAPGERTGVVVIAVDCCFHRIAAA